MWHNLARLARYRGLIQSLVARELKARYRGSVLGFFWSFVNPLLLLAIYTFVFTYILPNRDEKHAAVRAVSCSAACCRGRGSRRRCNEASGSLIAGGNLIKKVLFPAEVLPIVSVLANMVHFFLGLLILAGFIDLATRRTIAGSARGAALLALGCRSSSLVQLVLHAGAGADRCRR